jgi:uncharacterized protein (DUF1330 family)
LRLKYYSVVEIEITDQNWVPDYAANVTRMIEDRGGRYLARTSKIEKIEGERKAPQILVIVEWPSKEIADTFYQSEEYQPYLRNRLAGARSEMLLAAGEDITKAAHIAD